MIMCANEPDGEKKSEKKCGERKRRRKTYFFLFRKLLDV